MGEPVRMSTHSRLLSSLMHCLAVGLVTTTSGCLKDGSTMEWGETIKPASKNITEVPYVSNALVDPNNVGPVALPEPPPAGPAPKSEAIFSFQLGGIDFVLAALKVPTDDPNAFKVFLYVHRFTPNQSPSAFEPANLVCFVNPVNGYYELMDIIPRLPESSAQITSKPEEILAALIAHAPALQATAPADFAMFVEANRAQLQNLRMCAPLDFLGNPGEIPPPPPPPPAPIPHPPQPPIPDPAKSPCPCTDPTKIYLEIQPNSPPVCGPVPNAVCRADCQLPNKVVTRRCDPSHPGKFCYYCEKPMWIPPPQPQPQPAPLPQPTPGGVLPPGIRPPPPTPPAPAAYREIPLGTFCNRSETPFCIKATRIGQGTTYKQACSSTNAIPPGNNVGGSIGATASPGYCTSFGNGGTGIATTCTPACNSATQACQNIGSTARPIMACMPKPNTWQAGGTCMTLQQCSTQNGPGRACPMPLSCKLDLTRGTGQACYVCR